MTTAGDLLARAQALEYHAERDQHRTQDSWAPEVREAWRVANEALALQRRYTPAARAARVLEEFLRTSPSLPRHAREERSRQVQQHLQQAAQVLRDLGEVTRPVTVDAETLEWLQGVAASATAALHLRALEVER